LLDFECLAYPWHGVLDFKSCNTCSWDVYSCGISDIYGKIIFLTCVLGCMLIEATSIQSNMTQIPTTIENYKNNMELMFN